jgi:hypothetical protein
MIPSLSCRLLFPLPRRDETQPPRKRSLCRTGEAAPGQARPRQTGGVREDTPNELSQPSRRRRRVSGVVRPESAQEARAAPPRRLTRVPFKWLRRCWRICAIQPSTFRHCPHGEAVKRQDAVRLWRHALLHFDLPLCCTSGREDPQASRREDRSSESGRPSRALELGWGWVAERKATRLRLPVLCVMFRREGGEETYAACNTTRRRQWPIE